MVAAAATVAVATAVPGWPPVVTPATFSSVQPRKILHVRDRNQALLDLGCLRFSSSGVGVGGVLHLLDWHQVGLGVPLAQAAGEMAATAAAVKERVTGVEFSSSLELSEGKGELGLVGVGVREKQIAFLKIKVYAIGFYLDASSVAGDASLAAWKGKSEEELSNNADFFKACADASVEKALKLVLVRDVTGNQFWDAFSEALSPRLKAAGAGSAGEEAMEALGQMFMTRSFQKGTNVLIFWAQPATMRIDLLSPAEAAEAHRAAAEPAFTMETPALLPSLFDIFLGKDSVSPNLKSSIASNFPTL